MRFIAISIAALALSGVLAGSAAALAFDDQSYNWPVGHVGVPYAKQLGTRGDCPPFRYTIDSGFMPPGVSLSIDGLASGTPQAEGSYSFWVRLRDCMNASAERMFTIVVEPGGAPAPAPLAVTTSSLRTGVVGQGYSLPLSASGGSGGQTWTASGLPAGLTLNGSTITGTPTAAGDFTVTVTVASGGASTSRQLTLKVIQPLNLNADRPQAAEVGRPLTAALKASGGTPGYTWTFTGLPAGVSFDNATGALAGAPQAPGTYKVHVVLTDSAGNTTASDVVFTVSPRLSFVTHALRSAKTGRAYRAQLAVRDGVRPVTWRAVGAPRGLRLDRSSGVLGGRPVGKGTYRIRVAATDALGATVTRSLVLRVNA